MNLSDQVPQNGPDWIARAIRNIQRQLQETAAARSLEAAEIGEGGLTVSGGGAISFVPPAGDPNVTMKQYIDDSNEAAIIEFTIGVAPNVPATIRGFDATTHCGLEVVVASGRSTLVFEDGMVQLSAGDITVPHGYIDLAQDQMDLAAGGSSFSIDSHGLRGQNGCYLQAPNAAQEWRVLFSGATTYAPIRASSFPTGSSRAVKQDIADIEFDTVEAVKAAPAQQWRYKQDYAMDPLVHVSPIAEDLPEQLVHEADGVKSIDPRDLTGVLWDVVRKQQATIEALTARVEALEAK